MPSVTIPATSRPEEIHPDEFLTVYKGDVKRIDVKLSLDDGFYFSQVRTLGDPVFSVVIRLDVKRHKLHLGMCDLFVQPIQNIRYDCQLCQKRKECYVSRTYAKDVGAGR